MVVAEYCMMIGIIQCMSLRRYLLVSQGSKSKVRGKSALKQCYSSDSQNHFYEFLQGMDVTM